MESIGHISARPQGTVVIVGDQKKPFGTTPAGSRFAIPGGSLLEISGHGVGLILRSVGGKVQPTWSFVPAPR